MDLKANVKSEINNDMRKPTPTKHMNPQGIIDTANAYYDSCVLFTACELEVFGILARESACSAADLAAACGGTERGCRLLLDACVALGLVKKQDGRYANTPEASGFLVPGQPADLTRALKYNQDVYAAWGNLTQFVRTGAPVERPETHLGEDTERTRRFVHSMHARALALGRSVVPRLELAGCRELLDVGGGPGTYSTLIAERFPDIHCTVMDLPGIVRIADELITASGRARQVRSMSGDYRKDAFPSRMDTVLFFGVLHQESPASILALFRKAHAALKPGGRIYIMDMMTDATHTAPKFSAMFAVNMALTTASGWVFSDSEVRKWLEEAGFVDYRCEPLDPPMPHWLAGAARASEPGQLQ